MIVVKVGGSLFDLPDLGPRLRAFLASLPDSDRLVVPGGGAAADAVRALDRTHDLGPEVSHWLALRACALAAHFLSALLPGAPVVAAPCAGRGLAVLDALAFAQADDSLPHSWDTTSDAVAARAAAVAGGELVLLKSVTVPAGWTWHEAAQAGLVDPVLPGIVDRAGLRVRAVNLREWPPRCGQARRRG
jgi:aspartokinase-like uncharacterized kinase